MIDPNKYSSKFALVLTKPEKSDARPIPVLIKIAEEISWYPGNFVLTYSRNMDPTTQSIRAPITGEVEVISPSITPARETWDKASPITDIFLFTTTTPMQGIIIDKKAPTIKAFIIYEY